MSRSKRKPLLMIVAGSLLGAGCLTGCDYLDSATGRASREVDQQVQEAELLRIEGQPERSLTVLEKAAGDKAAGDVSRIGALSALAEGEFTAARQGIEAINANQVQIARLLAEIDALGTQLENIQLAIAAQGKLEPTAARADLAKQLAAVKGGADQPDWFKHETTPLPTLSKVKQDISSLEGQITKLEDQLKSLEQERGDLLKQAEEAWQASETQSGQASVDAYKKGSDLRKQAAERSGRIDQANAALVPLRDALAVARGQEEILGGVIQNYEKQLSEMDAAWKQVQEKIEAQRALAREIAEGKTAASSEGDALQVPPTIAGKSALVGRLLEENASTYEQVTKNLQGAVGHFEAAAKAAEALGAELSKKLRDPDNAKAAELPAWKQLAAVLSPMQYRLREAMALQTLGGAQTTQLRGAVRRIEVVKSLEPTFEALGLKVPAELKGADLEQQRTTMYEDANASFEQTTTLLGTIIDSPAAANLRPAARVPLILAQYGWYQLERAAGNSERAQGHLQIARTAVQEAVSENVPMPSLPAELRSVQAAAKPQPAQAPAAE